MSATREAPKKLPVQFRAAAVDKVDAEDRTITFALTSETPVERWYGNETLSHDPSAVRQQRLKAGIPILFNHDRDQHLGRSTAFDIRDGKLYITAKFGESAFASEKLQDVRDGVLVDASGGYIVHEVKLSAMRDDGDDYLITDWEPVEASLVTIPADPTVGIGRALDDKKPSFPVRTLSTGADVVNPAKADKREGTMEGQEQQIANPTPAAEPKPVPEQRGQNDGAVRDQAVKEFREFDTLHRQHPEIFTQVKRDEYVDNKRTISEAREYVLGELSKRSNDTAARPSLEVTVDEGDKRDGGIVMARFVRSVAAGRGQVEVARRYARETLRDPRVERALAASTMVAGGIFVPEDIAAGFIDILRPMSIVRSFNPSLAPMVNGSYTMMKKTRGTQAQYIGENRPIPITDMAFGATKLTAKKLAAIVPISNDLLRYQSTLSDQTAKDDLAESIASKEDISFIRSIGTEFSPRGIRWQANAKNIIPVTGDASLANVTVQLSKATLALRYGNTPMLRPGWILSPRTENFLMNLRDGNGNFAFRNEMLTGKLQLIPYKVTTQLPENLGAGSETEIILADFADVVVGDVPAISVEISSEASYADAAGNIISAFQNDQTLVRMIVEHDLGVKRDTSIAVLTGVTWN